MRPTTTTSEWMNQYWTMFEWREWNFSGLFFQSKFKFSLSMFTVTPSHTHKDCCRWDWSHHTHTQKTFIDFFLRFCLFSPKLIGKTLCLWIINFFFSGEKKCFDIHFIFIETMPRKTRKPENKFSPFYYYYYWAFILAGRHQNDDDRKKNLIIEKSKWKMKNEKHRI